MACKKALAVELEDPLEEAMMLLDNAVEKIRGFVAEKTMDVEKAAELVHWLLKAQAMIKLEMERRKKRARYGQLLMLVGQTGVQAISPTIYGL